jgi:rhodanese-related sulfurtransferase
MVKEVTRDEVQKLIAEGAQVIDVLEESQYEDSHLPGALHMPLDRLSSEAREKLDRNEPVVAYCYDSLCDLSPRAAARLESLDFSKVHDYVASKVDWIGAGLPYEGKRAEGHTLGSMADTDVPTCRLGDTTSEVSKRLDDWEFCVVVDDRNILLGLLVAEKGDLDEEGLVDDAMQQAPLSFRPHLTPQEVWPKLEKFPVSWLLITKLDGTLVGVTTPEKVHELAHGPPQGHAWKLTRPSQ